MRGHKERACRPHREPKCGIVQIATRVPPGPRPDAGAQYRTGSRFTAIFLDLACWLIVASKAKDSRGGTSALPHWLNQRLMAKSCGISVQAFQAWNVKHAAEHGREKFYTVDDVIENRVAHALRKAEAARPPTPELPSAAELEAENILLTRERRIAQELKNAQTRRELAPVALIDWTLSKVGGQIAAILESLPLKVKKLLPRLTATEVEHIKREVVKAQNAAARVTVDLDEYYDRDPDGDRESGTPGAQDA